MKKITVLILFFLMFAPLSYSQFMDRFEALDEVNIDGYATPFASAFGLAMNSHTVGDADLPTLFAFSISLNGMYIMVPDDNKTYTPTLSSGYSPEPVATIFGDKGGAFIGPDGYQVTPGGLNQSGMPMFYPQLTFAAFGTELIVRYLPSIKVIEDENLTLLGLGLRHEISQYLAVLPLNVAVGILWSQLKLGDMMESNNTAFNVHASKSFGLFTPYAGLQLENSNLKLNYTYQPTDPNEPSEKIAADLDGENSFRFVLGTQVNLGFLALNLDMGFSNQTVFSGGLAFRF